MDVYKIFLGLLFLVIEVKASFLLTEDEFKRLPPRNPSRPASSHYASSGDTIPDYSDKGNSIYTMAYLPDGYPMHFYSKNEAMHPRTKSSSLMRRDGQELNVAESDLWADGSSGNDKMTTMMQAAKDQAKLYADYWHGKMQSGNHKTFSITNSQFVPTGSGSFQLVATMATSDGTLEMCCNIIIRAKNLDNGNQYAFTCAQPTCYRIYQETNGKACFPLEIIPGTLDRIHYTRCMKEIPFPNVNAPRKATNTYVTSPSAGRRPSSPSNTNNHRPTSSAPSIDGEKVKFTGTNDQFTRSQEITITFVGTNNQDLGARIAQHSSSMTKNNKRISFIKGIAVTLSPYDSLKSSMDTVATNPDIKAYADAVYGNANRGYTVDSIDSKQLKGDDNGVIYRVKATLQSSDGYKKMCCNMLLHTEWAYNGDSYTPTCAQMACFEPLRGSGRCFFLTIVRGINSRDFKKCWKERN